MEVHGTVEPGYEKIRDAFSLAQQEDEGGAQLAVYHHGKKVVDLWTGRDKIKDRQYSEDAIGIVMSVTKGFTATCAHILVQRGLLDVNAPVAKYWPEFAAAGKDHITVAHVLSHTSGLAHLPVEAEITPDKVLDWDWVTTNLAAMPPMWEPGSAFMYHAFTFGHLVGEIVRRITGKTIGTFFREEVAEPLNLDLWIGLPEGKEDRYVPQLGQRPTLYGPVPIAVLRSQAEKMGLDPDSYLVQANLATFSQLNAFFEKLDTRAGHAAEVPAANGVGDARSIAKLYAACLGEVDGVRLLSAETVKQAIKPQIKGLPLPGAFAVLPNPHPSNFGYGYSLPRWSNPMLGDGSFGHDGMGGRLGFGHVPSELAVGYVCSNMLWNMFAGPDNRWVGWLEELRKVAGIESETSSG